MTGVIQGCYRVNLMYRNQWRTYTAPYVTFSASGDAKILQNKIWGKDFVGVGGRFYTDKSGDAGLTITNFMPSIAYHNKLSEEHQVGAGIQLGYAQRSIDYVNLIFPQQFGNQGFNRNLPDGEDLDNTKVAYFDMNAGVYWNGAFTSEVSGFAGMALYHTTKPGFSFLNTENRLPRRYVIHGGSRIQYRRHLNFIPNIVFMYQGGTKELNLGSSLEYGFPSNTNTKATFSLGGWFRYAGNRDAIIVLAGLSYKNFKVGGSYDITISPLQGVARSGTVGGLEFSLTYQHPCSREIRAATINCPQF